MTARHRTPLLRRQSATGRERIASLDGLRAVALLIIMGYHFGLNWLPGGFIGVDIFYVLSGYLITGLLLSEYHRQSAVNLPAFWLARARRLLPALAIVLVAVTLMVRFAEPAGLYPDFRMSALSALFYFSNWWQIAASGNYFVATGAVSPLTHTWSLAVEEQFYLVWPLVVLGVMHLARGYLRGVRILLALSVVGAVASAVEMALLYNPLANTTRLYFGTDTHAQSILVGSAMACALTMIERRRGTEGMAPRARSLGARRLLVLAGLAGLAGTAILSSLVDGTSWFDYQGGFFLSALSSAAVIVAAVTVPTGVIARFLSLRPLIWLGTISYGAYLWHFPVFVYLDAARTGQTGFVLLLVRFAATFALAEASFSLVERRVMYGTFWRSLKALAPTAVTITATVAVIIAGTVVPATAAVKVSRFHEQPSEVKPPLLVVLGDSTAYTLGFALVATAPTGTRVDNGGLFGCGLALGTFVSNNPPKPELAMFPACNSATPVSQQWPALDARAVADTAPGDVVLFVSGPWEVQDVLRNGTWWNIEERADQRYLLGQMRKAVAIATANGAHLEFATMPALASGAAFNEPPLPEDSPKRRLIYDRLIDTMAAEYPGRVSVIDYGAILSPHGIYTQSLDGVQVRTADGIHTPSYAPNNVFAGNSTEAVAHAFYDWLAPKIWPLIIRSNRVRSSPATRRRPAAPCRRERGPLSRPGVVGPRPRAPNASTPSTGCGPWPSSSSWATTSASAGCRAASSAWTSSTSCPATSSPGCC